MAKRRLVKRTKTRMPEYTHLGCPLTKSHSLWCHALCAPKDGIGMCGRVAPHALMGSTGEAILKYKIQKARDEAEVQVA
jgi:hypothetical protein